ncbi:NUDIX domain-containing protein [Patescibacteria group bacterium]|nr:NUDIX domain-containing protein [Patescibacteria group bacterium]
MPANQKPRIHQLVICVNVFVRKDGKYLMLKRSSGKTYAPDVVHPIGGKIEPDEAPFLAAQREVLEEAGIKIKNMRLEAVVLELKPYKTTEGNWLIFHFTADYDSGDKSETDEGELILLDAKEILDQKLFPSVREIIGHILDPDDGTVFATFEHDWEGKIIQKTKRIDICPV